MIIVDNGWATCGAASEIAAVVSQYFEKYSDIQIRRFGFEQCPCPTTPSLENEFYPNYKSISSLANSLINPDELNWQPGVVSVDDDFYFKGPF